MAHDRRHDLIAPLQDRKLEEEKQEAAAVEAGSQEAMARLVSRLVQAHRGRPDELARLLAEQVPGWYQGAARLLLVRELGERGSDVAREAFGAAELADESRSQSSELVPLDEAALSAVREVADVIGAALQETELRVDGLLSFLSAQDFDVLRGALSLLRSSHPPAQQRSTFEVLDAVTGGMATRIAAGYMPLPLQLRHVFGDDAADVDIHTAASEPGGAGGVAIGGVVHLAPGRDGEGDEGRWRLGHEVAHVVQQRRGPSVGEMTPELRESLELEARQAGDAFLLGQRFAIQHVAPANVALFDSAWEKFKTAALASDKDALTATLPTLTKADKTKALSSKEKDVMNAALKTLGSDTGTVELKNTFARTFTTGLTQLGRLNDPEYVVKWFGVTTQSWLPGVKAIAADSNTNKSLQIGEAVLKMPDATPELERSILEKSTTFAWVKSVRPGLFVDEMLPHLGTKHDLIADVFKKTTAVAKWMKSDPTKFTSYSLDRSQDSLWYYVKPLLGMNKGGEILKKAATDDPRVADAVSKSKQFEPLMKAPPIQQAIVPASPEEIGFWKIYKVAPDAKARKLAFKKLYKTTMSTAKNPTFSASGLEVKVNSYDKPVDSNGWEARERSATGGWKIKADYKIQFWTKEPTAGNMDDMMTAFQQIPRAHIETVSHLVTGTGKSLENLSVKQWYDTAAGAWKANDKKFQKWSNNKAQSMNTSFYVTATDTVLMNVNNAGLNNTSTVDKDAFGVDIPSTSGQTKAGGSLTYFQNHATHEVGHSVGAKPFKYKDDKGADQNSVSGDSFAKTWSDWQDESRAAVIAAYWTKAGAAAPAGKDSITGNDASKYLCDSIATNQTYTAFLPAQNNPDPATVWDDVAVWKSIQRDYAAEQLTKYVATTVQAGRHSYDLLSMTFTTPRIYLWSGAASSFVSFKKQVYDERAKLSWYGMSHYREMFAEMYTNQYTGKATPTGTTDFFKNLTAATEFSKIDKGDDRSAVSNVTVAAGSQPGTVTGADLAPALKDIIKPWPG